MWFPRRYSVSNKTINKFARVKSGRGRSLRRLCRNSRRLIFEAATITVSNVHQDQRNKVAPLSVCHVPCRASLEPASTTRRRRRRRSTRARRSKGEAGGGGEGLVAEAAASASAAAAATPVTSINCRIARSHAASIWLHLSITAQAPVHQPVLASPFQLPEVVGLGAAAEPVHARRYFRPRSQQTLRNCRPRHPLSVAWMSVSEGEGGLLTSPIGTTILTGISRYKQSTNMAGKWLRGRLGKIQKIMAKQLVKKFFSTAASARAASGKNCLYMYEYHQAEAERGCSVLCCSPLLNTLQNFTYLFSSWLRSTFHIAISTRCI